jgi:asparagine synthase (glutamine-hydrolysing)
MCGIAGAVGGLDPGVLEAVRRSDVSQAHRGPDAEGFWTSPIRGEGTGAAFAHRRLAIIDLSEGGRQPMIDPSTGNVLCFNGEIYNFRQLRTELKAAGASFRTLTDTEVILHAYAAWGSSCVQRLRGMFAFALWDATRRCVFLARDRLGIKPLYIVHVRRPGGGRVLLFASELRALLEGGLVERRLNPRGLAAYLWNGFVTGPETIIDGVQKLDAGHTARISDAGEILKYDRYWQLPAPAVHTHERDALSRTLREAVELRLVSDVPIGVFLSGGIDSSAVAALATRSSGSRIRTFNLGFDEASYDESPHARAVAQALGTEHHEIRLTQGDFKRQLETALSSLDQPSFDAINTYFISRAVREAGMTVALSGAGGDELFGGYRSFVDVPRARRWARRLAPIPKATLRKIAAIAVQTILPGEIPPQTRWGKLGDALATRGALVELYQVSYGLFSSAFVQQLRRTPVPDGMDFGLHAARARALETMISGRSELEAVSLLELSCFVGDRLLPDTDAASMAVSLEVRVPLLDHEVIEAATALDERARYRPLGLKQALRDTALSSLDPALFDRPKSGFVLPLEDWSRDALTGEIESSFRNEEACEEVGLDPAATRRLWRAYRAGSPGIYWSRVWALFVLLHWARAHRVRL